MAKLIVTMHGSGPVEHELEEPVERRYDGDSEMIVFEGFDRTILVTRDATKIELEPTNAATVPYQTRLIRRLERRIDELVSAVRDLQQSREHRSHHFFADAAAPTMELVSEPCRRRSFLDFLRRHASGAE